MHGSTWNAQHTWKQTNANTICFEVQQWYNCICWYNDIYQYKVYLLMYLIELICINELNTIAFDTIVFLTHLSIRYTIIDHIYNSIVFVSPFSPTSRSSHLLQVAIFFFTQINCISWYNYISDIQINCISLLSRPILVHFSPPFSNIACSLFLITYNYES